MLFFAVSVIFTYLKLNYDEDYYFSSTNRTPIWTTDFF